MDKSKSKDNLRAAGKKRLEEFRQKKQQKGSSTKNSTALKVLTDKDGSLPEELFEAKSFATQHDNVLLEGVGPNLVGHLSPLVEPVKLQERVLPLDDSPASADEILGGLLSQREHPVQSGLESNNLKESLCESDVITQSSSSEETYSGDVERNREKVLECSALSKVSTDGDSLGFAKAKNSNSEDITDSPVEKSSSTSAGFQMQIPAMGDRLCISVDEKQIPLQEACEQKADTEILELKRQLEKLANEEEQVSNLLVLKGEQQLQETCRAQSLIAEMNLIQQELNPIQNEKVQLDEELDSSQEVQMTNQHLSSKPMVEQKEVAKVGQEASLRLADLELAEHEMVKASVNFPIELESSQQQLIAGEVKWTQLMSELTTSKKLLHVLQEENTFFADERRQFQNEIRALVGEKVQIVSEFEASKRHVQTLEEHLASDRRTLQQTQKLLEEKSQLMEDARDSTEKLEAFVQAKELELKLFREQMHRMDTENLGLKVAVEEFRCHLDRATQKEEELCVQHEESVENLKRVLVEKLELAGELDESKLLTKNLNEERSNLVSNLNLELELCREELKRVEEENCKLSNQVIMSRQELQRLNDEHVQAFDVCKKMVDCITEEKLGVVQELNSTKNELFLMAQGETQELTNLRSELHKCKNLFNVKLEESSSLTGLLEESSNKLQTSVQRMTELEVELGKHKVLSDGLLQEKGSLAAELLELGDQFRLMQQAAGEHHFELEKSKEFARELEEDHGELSRKLAVSIDELSELRSCKRVTEEELVVCKEQMKKLEDQKLILVKSLEDLQNDLQQLREDNLRCSSDFAYELDEQKALLSKEKERWVSELQEVSEQCQLLEQEMVQLSSNHDFELEKQKKRVRELEENNSKLSNNLVITQDELSKLREERSLAGLESARYKEQMRNVEDVNKDLVGSLEEHRESLGAFVDEKSRLLSEHQAELDRFKEQLRDIDETNVKLTAQAGQFFSDIENLKNDKSKMDLELHTWKGQYQKLGDENLKLALDFSKCKDQLQRVLEEKSLGESRLGSELEEYRKHVWRLGQDSALLMTEIDNHREHLKTLNEQKVNEIEELRQQAQELIRSHEQVVGELAVACQHIQVLEAAKEELASSVEVLFQQLKNTSEEKDILVRGLEVSECKVQELLKDKRQLALNFEVASNEWQVEKLQLSRDLVSLKDQVLFSATEVNLECDLANLEAKRFEMDAQKAQLAIEDEEQKELIQTSEAERAWFVAHVEAQHQQLQTLQEENSQLVAYLQAESEQVLVVSDEVVSLTEDLSETKHRIAEMDRAIAQRRTDIIFSEAQLNLFTEEKTTLPEELMRSSHELQVLRGGSSRFESESVQKSLQVHETALSVEKALQMKQLAESKEKELNQMKIQYALLQTKLEASNEERHDLAQDLITLRRQLQQISQEKSHVADELALGVEASRQRMLEIEETKQPKPKVERVMRDVLVPKDDESLGRLSRPVSCGDSQDGRRSTFEANVLMPESSLLCLERAVQDVFPQSLDLSLSSKSDNAGVRLAPCVAKLANEVEEKTGERMQGSGAKEHLHDFKMEIMELFSELTLLRKTSRTLKGERDDAWSAEYALHAELKTEREHLRKAVEENLHLTSLLQKLDNGEHRVEVAFVEGADLHNQLKELREIVGHVQVERDTAVEELFAVQSELRQLKESLQEENALLAGRLEVLEANAANLQTERDNLAWQLGDLEQRHAHLSERAMEVSDNRARLQDKLSAFELELAEKDLELGNYMETASNFQLHFQSLIQKLEDAISDAFPEAGGESVSSQDYKRSADYCYSLASRLHTGTREVWDQLQSAHIQLSEIGNELSQSQEQLKVLQQERNMAVEASEQIHSQLEKAAEGRAEFEAYSRKVEAAASSEKQELVTLLKELTQRHDVQLVHSASLKSEVSILQKRIAEYEAAMMMEVAASSKLEGDVKAIVSKLVTQNLIGQEEAALQNIILDPYPGRQLEACISVLLETCGDRALQIDEKQRLLQNHMEENTHLHHLLQSMQESLQSEEFELDFLNRKLEEEATTVAHQADKIEGLLLQIRILTEQVETENTEKESLRSGLVQAEQKLSVTREKLSLAVNKGKAVVQQRDTWKLSLAEKSKDFDLLVAAHQQDVQVKDTALQSAEMKIRELTASMESMARMETHFAPLQDMVNTLEHMFHKSDNLVSSLCAVLDSTVMPNDWHSNGLVDKVLWITGSIDKVLLKLAKMKEEVQTLTERATLLETSVEISQAREAMLASQLGSLELEKEELVSKSEDIKNSLQLELRQMTEEKVQLSGILRRLDLDVSTQRLEKEGVTRKLEDQTTYIVRVETEINSLQRKVSEQEVELGNKSASHQSLEALVDTIVRNLTDLYETILSSDLDNFPSPFSVHLCKGVMKPLIHFHNLMVEKLSEILHQASHLSHASGQAWHDHVVQILEDKGSSRGLSSDFIKVIEEGFANIDQNAISSQSLLQERNILADDLADERKEKNMLLLELSQKEQTLISTREELSSAVSKEKLLVQQHDALKQVLAEKNAELQTLGLVHEEDLQSKEVMLQETSQKLVTALDQVAELEEELGTLKGSVPVNVEPSLIDQSSQMNNYCLETQLKADCLSSELGFAQAKLEKMETEVGCLLKDKEDLVQQLKGSSSLYRAELQELVDEKTLLISKITNLEHDLVVREQEREEMVQKYEDLSRKYDELKTEIVEGVAEMTTLRGDKEKLQHRLGELEMWLRLESDAQMKLVSDTEAAVANMQHISEDLKWPFDSMTSIPNISESSSELVSLSTLLVLKYETAMQKVEELSKEKIWLTESLETMTAKALAEQQLVEQLQEQLALRDIELIEVSKRMEETASRRAEHKDNVQNLLEEVQLLTGELEKSKKERDSLQSELMQLEQKSATTREKLGLAIKKGKGLAQQRDSLKQSLSELEMLVSSSNEAIEKKESALENARYEISVHEEQVCVLELEINSLKSFVSTLEQQLQDKDDLTQKLESVLTKCEFPYEMQSRKLAEKLEWLVATVADAKNALIITGQEVEAIRKASVELTLKLTDAQSRAAMEQESHSILSLKLEEGERQLKFSQNRISELEAQLSAVGGASQQAELLCKKVTYLEAKLQQKQAEVSRAEEAVFAWAERSKESEAYIRSSQERISELEEKVEEMMGAEQQVELLQENVAKLEDDVQQKQAAVKAIEASRGKAVHKLTVTVNKFRELCQQSEGLVAELEHMHGNLQEKDAEIARLKEEIVGLTVQCQTLQEKLGAKMSFLLQLEKQLEVAKPLGTDSDASQSGTDKDVFDQLARRIADEDRCLVKANVLQKHLEGLKVQSQALEVDMEKKDTQLQELRKEIEKVITERAHLKADLQREQLQSERLKADFSSLHTPITEKGSNQIEEIEEVQVGKRSLPSSSPAPHVRGARRPASFDVAIDVDTEKNQMLAEFDDKGHGFKSLASSNFMPRGTRSIAEQIDRLCVAGGRVLMRQPGARLGLTLYWLSIHIWMVLLISTAHM